MENPYIRFRQSHIHGTGGYARCDILAGTSIIEYVGERIDKTEAARRCEDGNYFIFYLNEQWDIDGSVESNPARFINHSCEPNCETELDEDRIWITALRDIKAGEELSFNYCYDLESFEEHPCRCGSAKCVGYIVAEEHFPHVRRHRERRLGTAAG